MPAISQWLKYRVSSNEIPPEANGSAICTLRLGIWYLVLSSTDFLKPVSAV